MVILNYAAGLVVFYLAYRYGFNKKMVLKYPVLPKGYEAVVSKNMSFLLFSIATSMVFLGPLSLVKYAVWILILGVLSLTRFRCKLDVVMWFYLIFLAWCGYALTYSLDTGAGVNMLVKYCLPVLYFWLGYNAIESWNDVILCLKYTVVVGVIYACIIGGVTHIVLNPLYYFLMSSGLCVMYASLADFYACIICVPIALYILSQKKIYLWAAGWLALSTVAAAVRTGMGGMTIALATFAFIVYKFKSIPYVVVAGLLFVGVILFIPSVNEKMFSKEINTTDISMNMGGKSITMNGRQYTWEWGLNRYYKGNESHGSGLGSALSGMKKKRDGALFHSDYVQMLCEIGNVGLALFILFALMAYFKSLFTTIRYSYNKKLTIIGAIATGSLGGMLFCMAFDNVVTYSQQTFVIPFMFMGIFQKCVELEDTLEDDDDSLLLG